MRDIIGRRLVTIGLRLEIMYVLPEIECILSLHLYIFVGGILLPLLYGDQMGL